MNDGPITVVITTSPIPSHPRTEIIASTIESVRFWLPDAPLLVLADGVRPEQADRRADYLDYIDFLTILMPKWRPATLECAPDFPDGWRHQAALTRWGLDYVDTPLILFVEHDTPLLMDRDIEWSALIDATLTGQANLIRLHHESHVLAPHEYLMRGPVESVCGAKMRPTVQWSQRPHLASTSFYRAILDQWFTTRSRTMIEDTMHSVCQTADWNAFRLWLYHPDGDSIQRSTHLDGRETDLKYEMQP